MNNKSNVYHTNNKSSVKHTNNTAMYSNEKSLNDTNFSSFEAKGNSLFFFRSVLAIIATSSPCSFTMGSFPV